VAEIPEQPVLAAQIEIEAAKLGIVSVLAHRPCQVVVGAIGAARLVGQRIVLKVILGDGAEPVGGDEIAGERRARDAPCRQHRRGGIVDLVVGANLEQRGKIAGTLRRGRHHHGLRLGEAVVDLLPYWRAYWPTKIIAPSGVRSPPTDACTATAPAGAAGGIRIVTWYTPAHPVVSTVLTT